MSFIFLIILYKIVALHSLNGVLNINSKYELLKSLEKDSNLTQRQLSKELGISLGKVNYCLQSLVEKGLVKIQNFKSSNSKAQYAYLLTPKGVEEKSRLTIEFLKTKTKEYEMLKNEVEKLTSREKNS
jgi:EPS-associated MarR family transcriptional regulator